MTKKLSLVLVLVSVAWIFMGAAAAAGDTLEFTPVGVYFNTACSSSGYANLCGNQPKDDWYFVVRNKSDKTLTAGSVVYVLLVETRKQTYVLTGATLDLFRKWRISTNCAAFTPVNFGVLAPGACAFMGKTGGSSTLEWADVPIFDYNYMKQEGIIRAGVRINWSVTDSRGFSDSGTYTYYPEILAR